MTCTDTSIIHVMKVSVYYSNINVCGLIFNHETSGSASNNYVSEFETSESVIGASRIGKICIPHAYYCDNMQRSSV